LWAAFGLSYLLGFPSVAFFVPLFGIILIFGPIGIIGYYYDAKALSAADAAWQPNPWVWIVGGFIFGHVLLMPVYLAQRWRTVGLDWSKLPLLGHRISK
jgi:hypothetical protein